MDLATNRAAYRLADNHDQEVLGYMAGYAQASQHANANALNTSVNGTKAVTTAGSNELLSSMQLHKGDFGNITTSSAGTLSIPCDCTYARCNSLPTATVSSPAMVIARMKAFA